MMATCGPIYHPDDCRRSEFEAEIERLRALLHRWMVSCAEETSDLWIESRDALKGDK